MKCSLFGDPFDNHGHIGQEIVLVIRRVDDFHRCVILLFLLLSGRISAKATQLNEKDRVNQEELDIKCFQLLRAIIHNEIVKLPEEWESDMKSNRK